MHPTTILLGVAALTAHVYAEAPEKVDGMEMVWSDDFEGEGNFNKDNWKYYTDAVQNGEEQTYPDSGDYCKLSGSGSLVITPEKEGSEWKSCRIESTKSWNATAGGKIQVQAKIKLGFKKGAMAGVWPAFWMLGESMRHGVDWPGCGEIDILETKNGETQGLGTLHCTSCGGGEGGKSRTTEFDYNKDHIWAYVIDLTTDKWEEQSLTFMLDGKKYGESIKGSDVGNEVDWEALAHKSMYITLNVAMGGQFPGPIGETTLGGKDNSMEIKSVAVYTTGAKKD